MILAFHRIAEPRHRRGLTLLELVIVILILSIMTAVATPRFFASLALHRVETAAERIQIDCQWARRRAKTKSADQIVQFDPATDSYTLPGVTLEGSQTDYQVELKRYPYAALLTTADFGGETELVFDGFGLPRQAGVIIVKVGSFRRQITIDAETGGAVISEL